MATQDEPSIFARLHFRLLHILLASDVPAGPTAE
jgi:hypothetical protein